jgi:hypothetical protein
MRDRTKIPFTQRKFDVSLMEDMLAGHYVDHVARDGRLYVECGPCKPWSVATVRAIERRGYPVRCVIPEGALSVFYVYPKQVQAEA